MMRQAAVPEVQPAATARVLRQALVKAAQDEVGLRLAVSGVEERVVDLDALTGDLLPDGLLMPLENEGEICGVACLNRTLLEVLVVWQTTLEMPDGARDPRQPTGIDFTLCAPVVSNFLAQLPTALAATPLAGWLDGAVSLGNRLTDLREVALQAADVDFRVVSLSIPQVVAGPDAELLIALPDTSRVEPEVVPQANLHWADDMARVAARVPAQLDATLCRIRLPLHRAQGLSVGQIVLLPGADLDHVVLSSIDKMPVATGKLGQSIGKRAVRLQEPPARQLFELPPVPAGTSAVATSGAPVA